jgi:hypothetical protein
MRWLTALLMWGGGAVTIVSAIAVVYVVVVAPAIEGAASGAPMTLYVVLIVAGLAAAIVGWLMQR